MSFLDPQSWIDVDAGGNPLDWTSRQSKLLYPGYEMLRKALVERCAATGTAIPAVLNVARAPGRIYTGGWFSAFHSKVSSLIPKFVNQTDNGGDWDGLATFAPNWNEADILTAIGDATRIPAPDIPLAEWSLQQYKILNLLLWKAVVVNLTNDRATKQDESVVSWAEAVTKYLAEPWDASGTQRNSGYGTLNPFTPRWGAVRWRCKARITAAAVASQIDWYLYMDPGPGANIDNWDDEGMGFSQDTYWLFEADSPYAASVVPISGFPTAREDPPPEPTVTGVNNHTGWNSGSGNLRAIVKFNVTDGFKFV